MDPGHDPCDTFYLGGEGSEGKGQFHVSLILRLAALPLPRGDYPIRPTARASGSLPIPPLKTLDQNPRSISHVLNEQGTGYEHIFSSVQTFNID